MDEWWDVTDASGNPIGRRYRRGDPDWPSGYFHLVTATCVLNADGAMLLTQRAATKDFPHAWEFPGGSALPGESSLDAALRELFEETGLHAAADEITCVGRYTETSALFDLYVASAPAPPTLSLDPSEVADAEWVTAEEVQRRLEAGRMAEPWGARFEALWPSLVTVVEGRRS